MPVGLAGWLSAQARYVCDCPVSAVWVHMYVRMYWKDAGRSGNERVEEWKSGRVGGREGRNMIEYQIKAPKTSLPFSCLTLHQPTLSRRMQMAERGKEGEVEEEEEGQGEKDEREEGESFKTERRKEGRGGEVRERKERKGGEGGGFKMGDSKRERFEKRKRRGKREEPKNEEDPDPETW